MRKLGKILLVDDEEASNFLNKIVIRQSEIAEEVIAFQKAAEALDYLISNTDNASGPDLVLLDINMPIMNGWEFVESYEKAVAGKKPVIIMLTSSINPEDQERAKKLVTVAGFKSKPLTTEMLQDIVDNYMAVG